MTTTKQLDPSAFITKQDPATGAVLVADLSAPRLAARITPRRTIVVGAVLALVAFLALLAADAGTHYLALVGPLMLLGAGVGPDRPAADRDTARQRRERAQRPSPPGR